MIRKACVMDALVIQRLIKQAAKSAPILPRSLNSIYENLRDFVVCEREGAVVGCCALHVSWDDLAELRSLVVDEVMRGSGLGRELVAFCAAEACELGISRVFLLTAKQNFFEKLGFKVIDKATLPHKIWRDCMECVQFPDCCESAMMKELND